jgi:hypothetical protein
MSDQLEPVRAAFEKAIGPFRKRQKILEQLKEPDVGKTRRSSLATEAVDLEKEWTAALMALTKAMKESTAFPGGTEPED